MVSPELRNSPNGNCVWCLRNSPELELHPELQPTSTVCRRGDHRFQGHTTKATTPDPSIPDYPAPVAFSSVSPAGIQSGIVIRLTSDVARTTRRAVPASPA